MYIVDIIFTYKIIYITYINEIFGRKFFKLFIMANNGLLQWWDRGGRILILFFVYFSSFYNKHVFAYKNPHLSKIGLQHMLNFIEQMMFEFCVQGLLICFSYPIFSNHPPALFLSFLLCEKKRQLQNALRVDNQETWSLVPTNPRLVRELGSVAGFSDPLVCTHQVGAWSRPSLYCSVLVWNYVI